MSEDQKPMVMADLWNDDALDSRNFGKPLPREGAIERAQRKLEERKAEIAVAVPQITQYQ